MHDIPLCDPITTVIAQTGTFHRIYFQMIFSEVFYDILAGYGAGEARFSGLAPGIYGPLGEHPDFS